LGSDSVKTGILPGKADELIIDTP